jgi:uncharacterized MAPEG superfamily protein
MSAEIYWLTLSTVLTALLFMPYGLNRAVRYGLSRMAIFPPMGDDPFEAPWAHRAYRAHMNAIECLVTFAPLAIAVHVTGVSNEITQTACAVYFFARVAHAPIYIFKVPVVT